jgi:hypothetical protein
MRRPWQATCKAMIAQLKGFNLATEVLQMVILIR